MNDYANQEKYLIIVGIRDKAVELSKEDNVLTSQGKQFMLC